MSRELQVSHSHVATRVNVHHSQRRRIGLRKLCPRDRRLDRLQFARGLFQRLLCQSERNAIPDKSSLDKLSEYEWRWVASKCSRTGVEVLRTRSEARNCDVFKFQTATACVPEMGIINEEVGDTSPIAKLAGNNPVWCAEDGKATDPTYKESATFTSATPHIPDGWSMVGCLARSPNVLAFPKAGMREVEVHPEMSPDYCINSCSGYSVSHEMQCDRSGIADRSVNLNFESTPESNVSVNAAHRRQHTLTHDC